MPANTNHTPKLEVEYYTMNRRNVEFPKDYPDFLRVQAENIKEDAMPELPRFSSPKDDLDEMLTQFDKEINKIEENFGTLQESLDALGQGLSANKKEKPSGPVFTGDLDQIFADFDKEVHRVLNSVVLEYPKKPPVKAEPAEKKPYENMPLQEDTLVIEALSADEPDPKPSDMESAPTKEPSEPFIIEDEAPSFTEGRDFIFTQENSLEEDPITEPVFYDIPETLTSVSDALDESLSEEKLKEYSLISNGHSIVAEDFDSIPTSAVEEFLAKELPADEPVPPTLVQDPEGLEDLRAFETPSDAVKDLLAPELSSQSPGEEIVIEEFVIGKDFIEDPASIDEDEIIYDEAMITEEISEEEPQEEQSFSAHAFEDSHHGIRPAPWVEDRLNAAPASPEILMYDGGPSTIHIYEASAEAPAPIKETDVTVETLPEQAAGNEEISLSLEEINALNTIPLVEEEPVSEEQIEESMEELLEEFSPSQLEDSPSLPAEEVKFNIDTRAEAEILARFTSSSSDGRSTGLSLDMLAQLDASLATSSSSITKLSREELTTVMGEIDNLLEYLPNHKIEELAHKDFYFLYLRLMDDLGL